MYVYCRYATIWLNNKNNAADFLWKRKPPTRDTIDLLMIIPSSFDHLYDNNMLNTHELTRRFRKLQSIGFQTNTHTHIVDMSTRLIMILMLMLNSILMLMLMLMMIIMRKCECECEWSDRMLASCNQLKLATLFGPRHSALEFHCNTYWDLCVCANDTRSLIMDDVTKIRSLQVDVDHVDDDDYDNDRSSS